MYGLSVCTYLEFYNGKCRIYLNKCHKSFSLLIHWMKMAVASPTFPIFYHPFEGGIKAEAAMVWWHLLRAWCSLILWVWKRWLKCIETAQVIRFLHLFLVKFTLVVKKRVINAHTHSSLYSRENPRQEIATPNQYPFFSKAQDLSVEKKSRIFPVKLFFFYYYYYYYYYYY